MIEAMFLLSGTNFFGDALFRLDQIGLFTYILPLMLVFALVYGIMTKLKIFENNNAINGVIAISVALMSLQFNIVNVFFAQLFPKVGVGLAIILALLLMLGLFIPKEKWAVYVIMGVSAVIFVIVLVNTAADVGWSSGYWWYDNWEYVAGAIFILILFGLVFASGKPEKDTVPDTALFKAIFGKKGE